MISSTETFHPGIVKAWDTKLGMQITRMSQDDFETYKIHKTPPQGLEVVRTTVGEETLTSQVAFKSYRGLQRRSFCELCPML